VSGRGNLLALFQESPTLIRRPEGPPGNSRFRAPRVRFDNGCFEIVVEPLGAPDVLPDLLARGWHRQRREARRLERDAPRETGPYFGERLPILHSETKSRV
jgi:hypothetical protein